jgi:hypothetical protein
VHQHPLDLDRDQSKQPSRVIRDYDPLDGSSQPRCGLLWHNRIAELGQQIRQLLSVLRARVSNLHPAESITTLLALGRSVQRSRPARL